MSALVPISHQFVNLIPYPEHRDCGACDDWEEPCPEYGPTDPLYLQLKNEPQPFTECLSPCLGGQDDAPCGNFLVNVDMCPAGALWTLNDSWAYNGCKIEVTAPGTASIATLDIGTWQAFGAGVFRFSFNLNTVVSGGVFLSVGTLTSPTYTFPGTYEWIVYIDPANINLPVNINATADFVGSVISFRVGVAAIYWLGYDFGSWTFEPSGCGWTHQVGNSTPLVFNYPTGLLTVKLTFRIAGVSNHQAYVDLYHGTQFVDRIYGNGTFTRYYDAYTIGSPTWTPSANWDGSIYLDAYAESPRGHVFALTNGSNVVTNLDPYYEGDYVTVGPWYYQGKEDVDGNPIQAGCYSICVWDSTQAGSNPFWEVVLNSEMEGSANWIPVPTSGSYDWATSTNIPAGIQNTQFQADNYLGSLNQTIDARTSDNACYQLIVEIDAAYSTGGLALAFSGWVGIYAGSQYTGAIYPTAPGIFTFTFDPIGSGNLSLDFQYATFAIRRVSLRPCPKNLPVYLATYCSDCVRLLYSAAACDSDYVEGHVPGSYEVPNPLIPGLSEWRSPVAYGFQFNRFFKLGQRCRTYFLNPSSDGEDSRYVYRNGRNQRTAGEVESRWELVIGKLGYVSHQAMATLVKCPEVRLVPGAPLTTAGTKYLVTSDEYSPNWPKAAHAHTADVQVEVVRLENSRRYLRAIF